MRLPGGPPLTNANIVRISYDLANHDFNIEKNNTCNFMSTRSKQSRKLNTTSRSNYTNITIEYIQPIVTSLNNENPRSRNLISTQRLIHTLKKCTSATRENRVSFIC